MSDAPVATTVAQSPLRKFIVPLLKCGLAIGILALLYSMCGKDLAKLTERKIVLSMFGAALLVRIVSLLATFNRWGLLVRGIGLPLSFRETFRLGMLGEACNLMGPGAVGGDLVKAALLAKDHTNRIASVFATVFLDRVLGMWALFILGSLASLVPTATKPGPELQWAVYTLWGGSLAGLIGIGLMFMPAFTHSRLMHWITTWKFVGRIVKELMDSIHLYQKKPHIIFGAAALGLLGHFGYLTSFYLCARSLHEGQIYPGYIDHVVGLPLPEALSAAVPTPGGVGALEGAVGWFYEQYQVSVDPSSTAEQKATALSNGILTALGYRLTMFVWAAVGVVFYLVARKEIRQAIEIVDAESHSAKDPEFPTDE